MFGLYAVCLDWRECVWIGGSMLIPSNTRLCKFISNIFNQANPLVC